MKRARESGLNGKQKQKAIAKANEETPKNLKIKRDERNYEQMKKRKCKEGEKKMR